MRGAWRPTETGGGTTNWTTAADRQTERHADTNKKICVSPRRSLVAMDVRGGACLAAGPVHPTPHPCPSLTCCAYLLVPSLDWRHSGTAADAAGTVSGDKKPTSRFVAKASPSTTYRTHSYELRMIHRSVPVGSFLIRIWQSHVAGGISNNSYRPILVWLRVASSPRRSLCRRRSHNSKAHSTPSSGTSNRALE